MAGQRGGQAPYAAVILIHGLTDNPTCGTYVRGQLALSGVDLSTDLPVWLDAVYAAWMGAPHDLLEKAQAQMVKAVARLRPEAARETWGLRPEHQAMAGRLGQGGRAGQAPSVGPTQTQREIDQLMAVRRRAGK